MRNASSIFIHPICLVVFSVGIGYGVHRLTAERDPAAPVDDVVAMNRPADAAATPEVDVQPVAPPSPPSLEPSPSPPPQGVAPEVQPAATPVAAADATPESESAPAPRPAPPSIEELPPVEFAEVWGYLYPGEESKWNIDSHLTDVCLFNYGLDETGKLRGNDPTPGIRLARRRGVRVHLVVKSSGQKSLLHFLVNPNYRARDRFVAELAELAASHQVDGFQLDFESLLLIDRLHFVSFLRELRSKLPPGMLFSIALPAREKITPSDPFRYRGLGSVADRFFIMIYDQHWKGGPPGSISDRLWFDRVTALALRELPREKVVLGLPFYGRIWQREKLARATRHSEIDALMREIEASVTYDPVKTHRFTFQKTVTLEGWFEDASTLHEKLSTASTAGAAAVGFWRLGQEDARVWKLVRPRSAEAAPAAGPGENR